MVTRKRCGAKATEENPSGRLCLVCRRRGLTHISHSMLETDYILGVELKYCAAAVGTFTCT